MNQQDKPDKETFETILHELTTAVEAIESGRLTLNEMVERFKTAEALAAKCQERLRTAEEEITGIQKS